MLIRYNESMVRLYVYWKSNLLPSSAYLVPISLCHVLGLCHSFKGYALPPSPYSMPVVAYVDVHFLHF